MLPSWPLLILNGTSTTAVGEARGTESMSRQRRPERLLHDAVVVVPGIMGSALRDVENDTPLWGSDVSFNTQPAPMPGAYVISPSQTPSVPDGPAVSRRPVSSTSPTGCQDSASPSRTTP